MKFLKLLILLLVLLPILFSVRAQAKLGDLEGKVFAYPGPNCFGVAMYANENIRTIRGVDLLEFSSFVSVSCEPVDNPRAGDIGTFHNGSDFIHAFIFLGDGLVLEKTGVDYMGQTPIHIREISHTLYTFEASPECRRWGGGSRECYNELQYFRCQKGLDFHSEEIGQLETEIESLFNEILELNLPVKPRLDELHSLIRRYEKMISQNSSHEENKILKSRLVSYQKQMKFLL